MGLISRVSSRTYRCFMESRKSKNCESDTPQRYSFLVFDDEGQDKQDVSLAAKFWKQFELEPQIESRLVSKDNISQSSRPTDAGNLRVRSQPVNNTQTQNSSRAGSSSSIRNNINRSKSITSSKNNQNLSVSDMVKQLKQTNKFLNQQSNRNIDDLNSQDFNHISDSESTTIESEMQQLDKFDEMQQACKNTVKIQ